MGSLISFIKQEIKDYFQPVIWFFRQEFVQLLLYVILAVLIGFALGSQYGLIGLALCWPTGCIIADGLNYKFRR